MTRDELYFSAVVVMSLIGGGLLTYLMGAALHWSLDPGDWSVKSRGSLVFLIWPLACAVFAVALHQSRED